MSEHNHTETGIEPEGISAGVILRTVILSVVLIVGLVIFGFVFSGQRFVEAQLASTEISGYPLTAETEMNGRALLSGYELVDPESNIYRIPIERAMELVAAESDR